MIIFTDMDIVMEKELTTMNDTYFDLASRLEESFHEIENDALSDLAETNEEYTKLQAQISQLKLQNRFIGEMIDGSFKGQLTEQQSAALVRFIDLYMKLEEMERTHLYFRGHTDAFAYLKKINAI